MRYGNRLALWMLVVLVGLALPALSLAQVLVPPGYVWQVFANGFNGVKHSVIDRQGGLYGGMMYVAELRGNVVDQVQPNGAWARFTPPPPGMFAGPVGVAIDFGGAYGGQLFVAEAMGTNLYSVNPVGVSVVFTNGLTGSGGIAFDPGLPGYGGLLYCAQWAGGPGVNKNTVMVVPPAGPPAVFANLPGGDPRYLAFDNTPPRVYGGTLWVSEYATGNVRPVMPGGAVGAPLANVGAGVEGISFGLGDAWFQSTMYTANLTTGSVDMISPAGVVTNFARVPTGAAFIQFEPAASPWAWNGMPTMYLDDGGGTIYRIAPVNTTPVHASTWGRLKRTYR